MRIENQEMLKTVLRSGVNLFTGAGFSVLAKNIEEKELPCGGDLQKELVKFFALRDTWNNSTLEKLSSYLNKNFRDEFSAFLRGRFTVKSFDERYNVLTTLELKNIFSVNIDDLIYRVYENSREYYIRDRCNMGATTERNAISYFPLHGSVHDYASSFVFTSVDINNAFRKNAIDWDMFASMMNISPSIFWGTSLQDNGTLVSLAEQYNTQPRWFLSYNPSAEDKEYLNSLGFFLIEGSTLELLDFLKEIPRPENINISYRNWGGDAIPLHIDRTQESMSIERFLKGGEPNWNFILGNNDLPRTHYFPLVMERILANQHCIITGIPASGKTTLLMQLAQRVNTTKHKLFFSKISVEKARITAMKLEGESALIFLDELASNIDAFCELKKYPHIQLIAVERESFLSIVIFRTGICKEQVVDITNLNTNDLATITNFIPQGIRNAKECTGSKTLLSPTSLYEHVEQNVRFPNLKGRYSSFLHKLKNDKGDSLVFFLLVCYTHYCRIPLSMDMLVSFYSNSHRITEVYDNVQAHVQGLGQLLADEISMAWTPPDDRQDYYWTRSNIVADMVMSIADPCEMKKMITRFYKEIPQYKIQDYNTFRLRAFDADIMYRAFKNSSDGISFYDHMFSKTRSPYILQQEALYLDRQHKSADAFPYIDRARAITGHKVSTINNTYANILFKSNINTKESPEKTSTLMQCMNILEKEYKHDSKKTYHAVVYAEHAIEYHDKYRDGQGHYYLKQAQKWLDDEYSSNPWNQKLSNIRARLKEYISLNISR